MTFALCGDDIVSTIASYAFRALSCVSLCHGCTPNAMDGTMQPFSLRHGSRRALTRNVVAVIAERFRCVEGLFQSNFSVIEARVFNNTTTLLSVGTKEYNGKYLAAYMGCMTTDMSLPCSFNDSADLRVFSPLRACWWPCARKSSLSTTPYVQVAVMA